MVSISSTFYAIQSILHVPQRISGIATSPIRPKKVDSSETRLPEKSPAQLIPQPTPLGKATEEYIFLVENAKFLLVCKKLFKRLSSKRLKYVICFQPEIIIDEAFCDLNDEKRKYGANYSKSSTVKDRAIKIVFNILKKSIYFFLYLECP